MSSSTSYSVCPEHKGHTSFRSITPEKTDQIANVTDSPDGLCTDDSIVTLFNQGVPLNRQRNAFLPSVSLPPEVLAMIFEYACYESDDEGPMAEIDRHWNQSRGPVNAHAVTPLFIGKVCSTWRNIALGASQLWASVKIFVNDKHADMLAAKLSFWLSKSAQRPLTVKLIDDCCDDVTSTAVIDILVAHAHRLHTIDLFVPIAWEPALIRIANCVPFLTRLTLRMPDQFYPIVESVNMFANAPQLREVRLFDYLCGYLSEDVSLPLAQLESLEGKYNDVDDYLETLLLCPRLRRSVFSEPGWSAESYRLPQTTHIALEVLELNILSLRYLQELLEALTLPALHSFVLWNHSKEQYKFIPLMLPFLSCSAGTLETLYLCDMIPAEEELIVCLRALPRLRKLVLQVHYQRLKKMPLTDRVLDLTNPTKHGGLGGVGRRLMEHQAEMENAICVGVREDESGGGLCLVPNLETFYYEGEISFTPHTLVEFLVARWRGSSSGCASSLGTEDPHIEGPGAQKADERLLPGLSAVPVVRLRSARFKTSEIEFEDPDAVVLQELRLEGMQLEFLEYGTS